MPASPEPFVVDSHALWWYFQRPELLSATADSIFRLAETGAATIVIPAIVVAEFYFLSVKLGQPFTPAALSQRIAPVRGIALSDLGIGQLALLERLPEIPDIHDRLIAAESLYRKAPLLTQDRLLRASTQLETVW